MRKGEKKRRRERSKKGSRERRKKESRGSGKREVGKVTRKRSRKLRKRN